jgi:hypothetical protein
MDLFCSDSIEALEKQVPDIVDVEHKYKLTEVFIHKEISDIEGDYGGLLIFTFMDGDRLKITAGDKGELHFEYMPFQRL